MSSPTEPASHGRTGSSWMNVAHLLPLKPKVFMVLLALRDGPDHARGIRTHVLERFDSLMGVDPGGLHRLVTRLEALGLIRSSGEDVGGIDDDEQGRFYELTHVGRSVLAAEARRLSRLARLPEVAEAAGEASA